MPDQTQSHNLRVIQSLIKPAYRAKNDTLELNADWAITPSLTLTSQTGYNKDFLWSTEDFNRYNTAPGLFSNGFSIYGGIEPRHEWRLLRSATRLLEFHGGAGFVAGARLAVLSQEVRLASNFKGPFNFSLGANYMHYQTNEDYFVFFNVLSALTQLTNGQGPGNYSTCVPDFDKPPYPISSNPSFYNAFGTYGGFIFAVRLCGYDLFWQLRPAPTSIQIPFRNLDGQGHNYFRSENPYNLSSYAGFGEAYYQLTPDVKLTAGLRWTDDQKTFWDIPSWVYMLGGGYPVQGVVNQEWKEWTGRGVIDWTPKLDFTDQTLVYASYSRGYKGGGANPPLPEADFASSQSSTVHPPTFTPEFVNAYELGTKNTLFDGAMTHRWRRFLLRLQGLSDFQDRRPHRDQRQFRRQNPWRRTGSELRTNTWPEIPFRRRLRSTRASIMARRTIDLMDRTAGDPDWVIVRPFIADTSNCILPANVVKAILQAIP